VSGGATLAPMTNGTRGGAMGGGKVHAMFDQMAEEAARAVAQAQERILERLGPSALGGRADRVEMHVGVNDEHGHGTDHRIVGEPDDRLYATVRVRWKGGTGTITTVWHVDPETLEPPT
jgi:hypothetical protein